MVSSKQPKRFKPPSLKSSRPPLLSSSKSKQISSSGSSKPSSRTTRTLIRAHHNLHKSRAQALSENNTALVASIDTEIEKLGGLEAYQAASLTGQSKDRGGDSSTILVKWLRELGCLGKFQASHVLDDSSSKGPPGRGLRVLEVGSLSNRNAISAMIGNGVELVKRIDLNSQDLSTIEEVDFMQFPIPTAPQERYDVLSLSLVLNYVPEAKGRGDMLKRTRLYLRSENSRRTDSQDEVGTKEATTALPCLFLVLPLPCVSNSRYMTSAHLTEIMWALGYVSIKVHQSTKLHYELFQHNGENGAQSQLKEGYKKIEINPGRVRNNFSIVIDPL